MAAIIVSLVVRRRRHGRRMNGWDWVAVGLHVSVSGVYLPIGLFYGSSQTVFIQQVNPIIERRTTPPPDG